MRSPAGSGSYTTLSPRQAVTAVPYALYATTAPWSGLAGVPAGLADGVDNDTLYSAGAGLALVGSAFSVDTASIQARVNGVCGAGYAIRQVNADGTVLCEPVGEGGGGAAWLLAGNAGTVPGTNFLGTTDNQALELWVNNARALRIEPHAAGSPNVIGGYSGNTVSAGAYGATIGGGGASGSTNRVLEKFGTVSGGYGNTANAPDATVGGGQNNIAGWRATVGGGISNDANMDYATVGGGSGNSALGVFATVGGGWDNDAINHRNTIGGGYSNTADGESSTIGGGWDNSATGWYSVVGGGKGNVASGEQSTVAGGVGNTAVGTGSTVSGGSSNIAAASMATIGGGESISVTGTAATVAGGSHITATGDYAAVGGGRFNSAIGNGAVVAGGGTMYFHIEYPPGEIIEEWLPLGNMASEWLSTVSGGAGNTAGGYGAVVGGGGGSKFAFSSGAVAFGNTAGGRWSTVSGGANNVAGEYATVAGGVSNEAIGVGSVVGGGGGIVDEHSETFMGNSASADLAMVGGGAANVASGYASVVGGGGGFVPAEHGFIKEAVGNTASGDWATVPGGRENTAEGNYSFAAGRQAKALHDGSFVWADTVGGDYASTGPNQFNVRAGGGVNIDVDGVTLRIEPVSEEQYGGLTITNWDEGQPTRVTLAADAGVIASSRLAEGVIGTSEDTYGGWFEGAGVHGGGGVYGYGQCGHTAHGEFYGVYGDGTFCYAETFDTVGIGVGGTGLDYGGYFTSTAGTGVVGQGLLYGGVFTSSTGIGLLAGTTSYSFVGTAIRAESTSPAGIGVYGVATHPDWPGIGVQGEGTGNGVYGVGKQWGTGVYGTSTSGTGGSFKSTSGVGLRAESSGNSIEGWMPGQRRFVVSQAGEVYADGTYHSWGADLAEMLPAVDGLQPGDVLVVGADGQLTRSTQPYQTTVVGVYSTQPGFLGGAGDDADLTGKVPLALVGLVPVKVTTENGPILPGDALTSSSIPGHAMKAKAMTIDGLSFFPSGVIIGKAMEALDEGTGSIQMLVMLQ